MAINWQVELDAARALFDAGDFNAARAHYEMIISEWDQSLIAAGNELNERDELNQVLMEYFDHTGPPAERRAIRDRAEALIANFTTITAPGRGP